MIWINPRWSMTIFFEGHDVKRCYGSEQFVAWSVDANPPMFSVIKLVDGNKA